MKGLISASVPDELVPRTKRTIDAMLLETFYSVMEMGAAVKAFKDTEGSEGLPFVINLK